MDKTEYPAVYKDNQAHIALVIKVGSKFAHVVKVNLAGIRITKMPKEQLGTKFLPLEYDVADCAKKFLAYGKMFGISEQAEKALNVIYLNKALSVIYLNMVQSNVK